MKKLNIKTGIGTESVYSGITYHHQTILVDNPHSSGPSFFLPKNMDLLDLITKHGRKKLFLFHYGYVISTIYLSRFLNKKFTKKDFVPINVDTVRTIISKRKAVEILRDLEAWGVVECDHHKKTGSKSYGYRLTEQYNSASFKKVAVMDKLIIKKMNNWKEKQRKEAEEAGADYLHLFNFIWQIDIQYKKALAFLNKNYVPFTDEYDARLLMIELIKERDIFFKVDKKGNRAHTNLTNLASDLRPFITYQGKGLSQVDLKNSQPFLFNLLIKDRIDYSNDQQVQEYHKFRKLTEQGTFYEFLMNEFGVEGVNRKDFKVQFFGRVFFDVNRSVLKKEEVMFQNLFPTIFKLIREFKQEDYTNLAIQLQRAESKIIINECIRRIRTERPQMFVSTIHDSIVVEPENLEFAKGIIEDVFVKHNLNPGIKMETFV